MPLTSLVARVVLTIADLKVMARPQGPVAPTDDGRSGDVVVSLLPREIEIGQSRDEPTEDALAA